MKPWKSIVYSFFLGGVFALIAQALLSITQVTLGSGPFSFFVGGSVLVLMGVIGCILGGLSVYQWLEKWATFGSLLPFSGFAMAVGMKMLGPWCSEEKASTAKSIWQGLWLVIWFNVVGAVVCIIFGFICTKAGVIAPTIEKTTSWMVFPYAYVMGGILTAFFQVCFLIAKHITDNTKPVWILMFAWCLGAILTPFGVSGWMANICGEGFSVMIPVGGYNMYNVGMAFALGEISEGLVHLGSFLLAVFFLFFTGLITYLIYRAKYGRTPINEVHYMRVKEAAKELAPSIENPAFSINEKGKLKE